MKTATLVDRRDASVLVEFLLGRAEVLEAVSRELSGALDEALHAPELIEPETLNALRRLLRNGDLDVSQADRAVSEMEDVRLIRYRTLPSELGPGSSGTTSLPTTLSTSL